VAAGPVVREGVVEEVVDQSLDEASVAHRGRGDPAELHRVHVEPRGAGRLMDPLPSPAGELMLAAPIPPVLVVLGNLAVAFAITALQVVALVAAAVLRGADFQTNAPDALWFVAGTGLLAIGMYGVAEILANRVAKVDEYIAATPAIAIVPWFFAGSLFPMKALPVGLAWFTRFLPLSHELALMRCGLLDRQGTGFAGHLGDAERHAHGGPQACGRGHVRRRPDPDLHPGVHTGGGAVAA
jgi:hypothetical protein